MRMWSFYLIFTFSASLVLVSSALRQDVRRDKRANCLENSSTKVNGKKICDGKLIFEDNFDDLNKEKWQNEVRFPEHPDYEFVMYDDGINNTYVKNGILHLRPTLLSDVYGENFLKTGKIKLDDYPSRCTIPMESSGCTRSGNKGHRILPPVVSSKIRTFKNFRFRYGVVEIRAKMATGDWIYNQITLEPKNVKYGPSSSGRIFLATSRGNDNLKNPKIQDGRLNFGNKWLEAGVVLDTYNPKKSENMVALMDVKGGWHKRFRTYRLVWKPDGFEWFVDGEKLGAGTVLPPKKGFLNHPKTGKMAPFDDEFYISLGVGVGGIQRFPDDFLSRDRHKPWKNLSPKNVIDFWSDRANWYRTWKGDDSALQVDYVKVWAL